MKKMSRIKPYSHRTFLELSVGTTHTVEVLVHLRRSDLPWFNNPNDLSDHQSQLFTLIGRRILPTECGDEIEADLAAWRHKRRKIGILIGEKNIAEAGAAAASSSGGNKKGKKKVGKGRGKKGTKNKGANAKAGTNTTLAALAGGSKKKGAKTKRDVDVQYLFADMLQVTYRVEDISTTNSATLLFKDPADSNASTNEDANPDGASKSKKRSAHTTTARKRESARKAGTTTLATYRQLKKLPKRIVIWVYPFDPANPTAPNPDGGGFPRPELIPLTSLFVHRDDEE